VIDPNVSIPYWDWTSPVSHREGVPKVYSEPTVGGEDNQLHNFNSPDIGEVTIRDENDSSALPYNPSDVKGIV
jgi:hypothetical protein